MTALIRRRRPRVIGPLLILATVLFLVAALLMALLYLVAGRVRLDLLLILALCGATLLFLARILPGWTARVLLSSARKAGALVEQNFSLSADGFKAVSTRGETLNRWPAIISVEEDEQRMFVFIGPQLAYVVPRRVFPGDGDYRHFVATTRDFFNASR